MIHRCVICQKLIFLNSHEVNLFDYEEKKIVQTFTIHNRCLKKFIELMPLKEKVVE